MLRGNRSKRVAAIAAAGVVGVIIAGIVIGWGALRQSEYNREANERSNEYTVHTYNPERDACVRLPIRDQPNCIADADRKAREHERGEHELVAQKTSALWTSIMGGAAILGMILSAIGIFLVYTTFQETRKTTQAAKEGNRIARDIGRAQTRAYITCSKSTYAITKDELRVHLVLENLGQSPALNVSVELGFTIHKTGGTREKPRNLGFLQPQPLYEYIDAFPQGKTTSVKVTMFKDINYFRRETDADPHSDWETYQGYWPLTGNGTGFSIDLRISWDDVFEEAHENKIFLETRGTLSLGRLPAKGGLVITPNKLHLAKYPDEA